MWRLGEIVSGSGAKPLHIYGEVTQHVKLSGEAIDGARFALARVIGERDNLALFLAGQKAAGFDTRPIVRPPGYTW
jgi:hypothetical protein